MTSGPITSWQTDEETMETVTDCIFLSSKIMAGCDCSHEIKRYLLLEHWENPEGWDGEGGGRGDQGGEHM